MKCYNLKIKYNTLQMVLYREVIAIASYIEHAKAGLSYTLHYYNAQLTYTKSCV